MSDRRHTSQQQEGTRSQDEEQENPWASKALPPPPPPEEDGEEDGHQHGGRGYGSGESSQQNADLLSERLASFGYDNAPAHQGQAARSAPMFPAFDESIADRRVSQGLAPEGHRGADTAGRGSSSRYPPRSHSLGYGVDASLLPAVPGGPHSRQTAMDFLREQNAEDDRHRAAVYGTARRSEWPSETASSSRWALPALPARTPSSTSVNSTERKRRLTAPDSPGRQPSGRRTRSSVGNAPSGSGFDPNSVDNSSHPRRPPFHSHPSRSSAESVARRQSNISDLSLPPWQPDHEVNQCPVCGNQFTFFYRKHHCRKCGRVVCAACSPHRITIPRQFIVHPPSESITDANIIDLTGSDDENQMSAFGPFRNPALGGGEVVRVCNPCVPDPNYSPPPQPPPYYTRPDIDPYSSRGSETHHLSLPRGHRASYSESHSTRDVFNRDGVVYQNRTRVADLWPPTVAPSFNRSHPHSSQGNPAAARYVHQQQQYPHGQQQQQPEQPAQQPRRQIAEEDECPVCGFELPPKGPNGEETAREEHISSCILTHSAPPTATSTPAPPNPDPNPEPTTITATSATNATAASLSSTSLPNPRVRGMSDAASRNTGGPGPGSARNRMSISARGMFPYIATEKDCVDDGGGADATATAAECVICFEEFEVGDRMARLVCWCKFHEDCIRQWWEKKGRGACPTHQLHE